MSRSEGKKAARGQAAAPEIPDKLYFRIGEVAALLDLPTYVLRFWESEFPHLRPTKGGTGQRLYRRRDVEALLEVRRLLYEEGYTIPGARRMLEDGTAPPAAAKHLPSVATPASDHTRDAALQHVHTELRELSQVLGRPAEQDSLPDARSSHTISRKRRAENDAPTLFQWPEEEDTSGM